MSEEERQQLEESIQLTQRYMDNLRKIVDFVLFVFAIPDEDVRAFVEQTAKQAAHDAATYGRMHRMMVAFNRFHDELETAR